MPKEWTDCRPILNERESLLLYQLDTEYIRKFGEEPSANPSLFYFMGDRFEWSKTWTATSGSLPTYRRNNAFLIYRPTLRLVAPAEKLASLGWPVTQACADAMFTKVLPSMDFQRCDHVVGNSMHLTCVATIMLVALSCFGPNEPGDLMSLGHPRFQHL